MTSVLESFFAKAWDDYKQRVPDALKIESFLVERGEKILNDHIALRTLNYPGARKEDLAQAFVELGYEIKQQYEFPEKKLLAVHLEGPRGALWPKVFISELLIEQMPEDVQHILSELAIHCQNFSGLDEFLKPKNWIPRYEHYQKMVAHSEYASWFYAHGWVVNHFTLNVNELKTFKHLDELNLSLENIGCVLNSSGGKIKGNPAELLEQSSTMAALGEVAFDEGIFQVPTSYYEFALRYQDVDGELFQGFVPASADKIFESTDHKNR